MIEKVNHKEVATSKKIYHLFQASYIIEAHLLKAKIFPPLQRTVDDIMASDTEFYALFKNDEAAAIVEVITNSEHTDIQSLVVHPKYFRQGLGMELMVFILNLFESDIFSVETGLGNKPAINLYKKLGFREVEQWDTSFGVRKIKLKKIKYDNSSCSTNH